jgi:hypothetical protein
MAGAMALALAATVLVGRPSPSRAAMLLRVLAVVLGAAGACALVDRMGAVPVPAPRWLRQWLRVLLGLFPAAVAWAGLATLLHPDHVAELATEALTCALTAFAGTAGAARRPTSATSALAGPVTQVALVAATLLPPPRYSPWIGPEQPHGGTAHRLWWIASAVAIAVLALANRDLWPLRQGPGPAARLSPTPDPRSGTRLPSVTGRG